VRRIRRADGEYATIVPEATYAPWNNDPEFRGVYDAVKDHSLVDVFRSYELWSLTRQLAGIPGALIEVGVWRGGSGALIATAARRAGIADPLYLCDTFEGVPKAGDRDPDYRGGEHADTSQAVVERLLSRLGVSNVTVVPGIFPESAGAIASRQFRLAHIDVDVYRSARECMSYLWPRLSVGGIVVFDDYGFDGTRGVRECVDELRKGPDRMFIHNLNGHGLLLKLA
jgi:O-methyltransferase